MDAAVKGRKEEFAPFFAWPTRHRLDDTADSGEDVLS
jgi:hypothetical protein